LELFKAIPAYIIFLISVIGVIIFNILHSLLKIWKKCILKLKLHLVKIDTDPVPDTDPERQALIGDPDPQK
jgi:hypothetical protein